MDRIMAVGEFSRAILQGSVLRTVDPNHFLLAGQNENRTRPMFAQQCLTSCPHCLGVQLHRSANLFAAFHNLEVGTDRNVVNT